MADAKKPPTTAIQKSLGMSLTIASASELLQLADILYLGGANQIPGCGRKEAVAHVILAGAEVGLTPTQALSTIMLVGGKTTVYGDGAMALVLASGLADEIKEWSEGEGDALTYYCRVKRKGETEPITREYSVADAKTAELWGKKDNWKKSPKRMLQMRARGFAFRDKFADVLKGLYFWEEVVDGPTVTQVGNYDRTEEVRVVSSTVDIPTAVGTVQAEGVLTYTATPATISPKQIDGPITDAQKEAFKQLYALVMASKGIGTDADAKKAAWAEVIKPYGVSSISQMTAAVAAVALEELGKTHDPFGGQASQAGAAA